MYTNKATKYGTLIYEVVGVIAPFKGRVTHDLHSHPKYAGKKLVRYSKEYKTKRGASNWVAKQLDMERKRRIT